MLCEAVQGDYSDGNTKHSLLFEAAYQLTDRPYLRLAYNYYYLDFKDPAPIFSEGGQAESAYYDPINFEVHSLRLEYRKNHNDVFSYGAEGALEFIPENGGVPCLISAFAQWRINTSVNLRFDARWFYQNKGIDRIGDTGAFHAENVVAIVEYSF